MPTPGYDYGPPVEESGEVNNPADTSGDEVTDPGTSPHTPPANTADVIVPGGSPSEEIEALHDPSIVSLTPATAVVGADATVTVGGTNFDADSVVEVDQAAVSTTYVSDAELTVTLADPGSAGTATVTVRNPATEMESNSMDFTWSASKAKKSTKEKH